MNKFAIGIKRAAITAIILSAISGFSSAPACSAYEDQSLKLLFEDNFDGEALDETKWERCTEQERCKGMDYWDNRLSYLDGNGFLVLESEWNNEEKRVHSGAVQSKNELSLGYGYYEASMRLPKTYGVWGAFWIMAGHVTNVDGGSEDGIEIDIIESIDNEQNKCDHALHWDGYDNDAKSDSVIHDDLNIYDGNFHTFAVWRTEDRYIFYIDGEETWRSAGGGICPLDGYMLLSMESAAFAGGGTDEAIAQLPTKTEVDYVRVWNTNPYYGDSPIKRIFDVDLSENKSGARVTATVKGENKNVTVIAAVYDDNMKLVGAQLRNIPETTAEGTAAEFNFNIKNIKRATAFIWKNAQTGS